MFYEIKETLHEIDGSNIDENVLTVGCVSSEELANLGRNLGFDEETIIASQKANPFFRTGVDVHAEYTFAELRIVNSDGHEDFISMYIKKNLILIVDIVDEDNSTSNSFIRILEKYPIGKIDGGKLIYGFIDALLADGNMFSEKIRNQLTEMEESVIDGTAGDTFNADILDIKKKIIKYYNYYKQMQDIAEVLEENDNEVLDEDNLIYISNLTNKVTRQCDDINALNSMSDHIQDAYATYLDQKMNSTMKIFTIITTIFFPLTIIVGWYGMNFQNMPELNWEYGYLYVSILSVMVVILLFIIGKKKKWF